jgi:hypothetical protein
MAGIRFFFSCEVAMNRCARFLLLAGFFALAPLAAQAKDAMSGLGVVMGDTTGVTFKSYLSRHWAFDVAAGLASGYDVWPGISTHADAMWTDEMVKVPEGALLFYFGGGVFWAQDTYTRVETGLRGLTGAEYFFHQSPWAVYVELAPTLVMTHSPGLHLHGALGARYYF